MWRIRLDASPSSLDIARRTLSQDEHARAARFRVDEARDAYVASHVALRSILAAYVRREPADLVFELGEHGKPRLADARAEPALRFNLTHSADLALCIVGTDGAVGIDVERVASVRNLDRLAERHFSESELAEWTDLSSEDRQAGFYRVWTRKEALLKAAGLGLSRPLERVDSIGGRLDGARYWLRDIAVGEGFRGAVACERVPTAVRCYIWEGGVPTDGS
ncbi:MAG: 4'-phosphopantetheinyl transferase superfamily protein [Gemmatimonadetes bacterium]|nr:4'-phosphopantetheinyl transferase superfamily protein [Gemmatimonadota bacterium]